MLFVAYTASPFVNQVYLSLPGFAMQSKHNMLQYLRNVPRTASLSIETTRYNFYPRKTEVALANLVPSKSMTRPVSFMRTDSQSPWWKNKDPIYFFAPDKSRPARSTHKFFPEVWERVFDLIKRNKTSQI